MAYFIRSEKQKTFVVEDHGEVLYRVKFPKWTNNNATARLPNADYQFKKMSFWKPSYLIFKNGSPVGKICSNWKGHTILRLANNQGTIDGLVPSRIDSEHLETDFNDHNHTTLTLKQKGIFKTRFELFLREDPRPLLTMHPKMDWFKFHYEIELHYPELIPFPLDELMGILGYAAVLIRARRGAVAA